MADSTQFDHDRIGHLLADRLLEVPNFQRSYAWESGHVDDFLADLQEARKADVGYFLGTIVFANNGDAGRQLIVDGQQRLTTTAVLLLAIRDLLLEYDKTKQANHIDETYLRGYDLDAEEKVERLILNPEDQPSYDALLSREGGFDPQNGRLSAAYTQCRGYLKKIAPAPDDYRNLIEITQQLDDKVQVLVAVASDLPEAYVIFETLNDRGADLTTADLLKNYLFSQSKQNFSYVQTAWTRIFGDFEKSEEFVKFLRYEYMSRHGHVTTRQLYKAMQRDIGTGAARAKKYVQGLEDARLTYAALRDVDSPLWDSLDFDTRDAVLAMRRFGLESSYPLIMAAFTNWGKEAAAKLFLKIVNWSIRALFANKLGGSVAEKAFCSAAVAVSDGSVRNQDQVREKLSSIIVDNAEFVRVFTSFGEVSTPRAKYLLAMLERANRVKNSQTLDGLPDWSSRSVTIEHLTPRAAAKRDSSLSYVETLGNMALLEKALNRGLEDKPMSEKAGTYGRSVFQTTSGLAERESWDKADADCRSQHLASLAPLAWPL